MESCEKAFVLSQFGAYKVTLGCKIAVNLLGMLALFYTHFRITKSRKFSAVHINVQLSIHLHALCVTSCIVFIVLSYVIDLYRLSLTHTDPCDYLLPFWLTFTVRQGYQFGLLGQTLTFVFLSIERIIATFRKGHEHDNSKKLFIIFTVFNMVICFLAVYVFLGFDAEWTQKIAYFSQKNIHNSYRSIYYVYFYITCEFSSIVLYNITYFLNSPGKNRIDFEERRINQISKSLTEKYQIDENRKVIRLMLPVCWSHFAFYIFKYAGYLYVLKFMFDTTPKMGLLLVELFEITCFYTFVFSFLMFRYFVHQTKARHSATTETADEYFNQMNALFRSGDHRPARK